MSSIEYCHNNGICHRDLKPENLLYLNAGNEKDNPIKVIDFGLSQIFIDRKLKNKVGTAYYVAPEILKGDYTEKCDIWSAGVILQIFLSEEPPFNGPNDSAIYTKISQMKFSFPKKMAKYFKRKKRFNCPYACILKKKDIMQNRYWPILGLRMLVIHL